MFKEINEEQQPIRYFNRIFTIILEGSGWWIKNEELHITQPTDKQLKELNSKSEIQMIDPHRNNKYYELRYISRNYMNRHCSAAFDTLQGRIQHFTEY